MSITVSPQIRIVALAGLLLAFAGGGMLVTLGRSHSAPERVAAPTTPARTTAQAPPRHAAAPPSHATKPVTKPAAHAQAPARPTRLVDARLPVPLQWALAQHRIVVVSLYNPRADVDAIAVAEAHAGAKDARVGFLLVNVLDDAVAGPLTALLPGGGLLPDPGILVYRAPGRLVFRYDGFADRESVAQAAANAKAGLLAPLDASATASTP